jgi:hypothetical protein
MPIFNFVQWTQQGGGTLNADGPLIPVEVGVPAALEQWLARNHRPIPAPVAGVALIDTGAGISGIHEPILQQLNIPAVDSIPLATPAGGGRGSVYQASVAFPAINVTGYQVRIVGNQLNWTTTDGRSVIMLLGRDILYQFLIVYNGNLNSVTLAF